MAGNKNDGHDDIGFEDFQFEDDLTPGADGGDEFQLEEMPVIGRSAPDQGRGRTVLAKPVVDEFDDDVVDQGGFGGDDFGGDDFGDASDEPVRPVSRAVAEDDFGDGFGGSDASAGDDFAVDEDRPDAGFEEDIADDADHVDGEQYQEAASGQSPIAKYGIYGGMAAAALVMAWLGYSTLLPMFMPSAPSQPALPTVAIDQPAPGPAAPAPSLPGMPTLPQQHADAPSLPGAPVLPGPPSEPSAPSAPETGLGPLPGPEAPDAPGPTGLSLDLPGNGDAVDGGRIDRIEAELESLTREDLVTKVADLERRLAALESRPVAETPRPVVEPPSKPQVIEDWALKGVQGGVAWIEGPTGFLEVRVGSDVPGVGKVTEVTTYENDWLVVTTAGVIMQN